MTLGDKIAKARKENNYTQEQLADLLGVSRQSVSKWESGLAYPETEKLIRISELFHCSLDYLLKDGAENVEGRAKEERGFSLGNLFRERKSEKTVRGMPLWHIGKNAEGFFAVGLNARGVFAFGLKATGIVSFGLLSLGVLSFGMLSVGILSFGLLALGILSAGCFSAGILTAGAICLGVVSSGAIAVGDFSVGALAIGRYFALGDNARAAVAIGKTEAAGTALQKIGEIAAGDAEAIRQALDPIVPEWLGWAKELILRLL